MTGTSTAGIEVPLGEATLRVDVLGPRLVRVRLLFRGDEPPGVRVAQPPTAAPPDVRVEHGPSGWTTETEPLRVHVAADGARLAFADGDGALVLETAEPGVAWEPLSAGRRRVQVHLRRALEEHFYGLGQAGARLDRDGTTRRLWNSHHGHGPGTDMAVPLLISSRGYGLFFDNSWDAEITVGRSDGGARLVYTAEGGALDWYLLYGPRPKQILEEYARLTGRPPLPPRWALGYIQSTRHFETPQEIVELAATVRDKHIPCDAIVFLSTYGDDMGMNNGVGTLEFHPRLWADAAGLMRALKERHFHVVWHEYPVLGPRAASYAAAQQRGYLVSETGSGTSSGTMFGEGQRFVDFSHPEVGAWWWQQHQPLVEAGVDGWWLDGGEGPPSRAELHAGPGVALHNVFDLARQQSFADGERQSRPDQRPWLLCRSGYAGMQRLGSASWSGDINNTFDVLEAQLPLGLSTAMSGVPYWGTDIGGFFHTVPETAELYVRWFQFAAFCPVFRSHGRGVGLRGWREHLPWAHGPEVEDICRAFATLRYQLMPYTYTLAWQAHRAGTPLMRPLVLEAPDDPMVVDMASEYLWGPSLLVAPVTRGGARRWAVYLPRGRWYDYWTQTAYAGQQWVEVDAPLERMPLFARGGAIIPLGPSREYLANTAETLSLLVYPDEESSSFMLYEDDGISRAYDDEDGAFALTQIACSASAERTRLVIDAARGDYAGKPATRSLRCQLYSPAPPVEVRVSGRGALRRVASAAELETTDGWWHDGRHFVWLRLEQADGPLEVEFRRLSEEQARRA